jgi:hypothetical protein
MIHRTCAKGTDKRETLYCSCGKDDDSGPLLASEDLEYDDELCLRKIAPSVSKQSLRYLYQESVLPGKCQLYCYIRCISNVLVISVSCVSNARQLMILKKKDITFHLPSTKHPRKGGGKMIRVNLPGVQKRKPLFESCPSAQQVKYQLVHLPKVLT